MIRLARRGLLLGAGALALAAPARAAGMEMTVWKNRGCGCCTAWAQPFQTAGYLVTMHEVDDLGPVRAATDVPPELAGCHTAEVGGYVVEGHVPVEDVERLLAERPPISGIAVPGMPVGSPGMELPGIPGEAYQVIAFTADGGSYVFRSIPAAG